MSQPDTKEIPNIEELQEIADELLAEKHSVDPDKLPSDMADWMRIPIMLIDKTNVFVGKTVCWTTLIVIFAMVYEVIARYFFTAPTIWAYDVSRMFYGALFMLGSGYALSQGVHIRADFIYRNWKSTTQAIVDLVLYLVFYFPGLIMFFIFSMEFATEAWQRNERGMDTAWMPYVYPIKSVLPISILLLLIQGVSESLKCLYTIKKGRWHYES